MIRVALLMISAAHTVGAPLEVRLWDDPTPVTGDPVIYDAQALTLQHEDQRVTVPWTRIASIEPGPLAPMAAARRAGLDIWRATQRLDRGDALGALPLLEPHKDAYMWKQGEVSLALDTALTRAYLAHLDRVAAFEPWAASGRGNADHTPSFRADLLPLWTDDEAAALLESLDPARVPPDAAARGLIELALLSASWQLAEPADRPAFAERFDEARAAARTSDPTGEMITEAVGALVADADTRATMRRRLRVRLDYSPDNAHALWVRVALGRSLAAEPDETSRRLGAIELLTAAFEHADASPLLAGKALAWASEAAGMVGDAPAADAFARELERRYPGHPDAPHTVTKDTDRP